MSTLYQVLGQAAPAADTPTDLYTVPAGHHAVTSTLNIATGELGTHTFSVALRPNGEALADKHYVAQNLTIEGPDTWTPPVNWGLAAGTVVTVESNTGEVAFTLSGALQEVPA